MKKTISSLLAMFLFACGDDPEPTKTEAPVINTNIPVPHSPEPIPVKECEVTRTTKIRDCVLYDLICDDGDTDMVLLCPIQYWERGPYIPTPP